MDRGFVARVENMEQVPTYLEVRHWIVDGCGVSWWAFTSRFEYRFKRMAMRTD